MSQFKNEIQWIPMNSNDSNHLSINDTNATNNFSRLNSVRAKPQSFEGWKDNVINICKSDNVKRLQEGHKLWKIRKKPLVGINWYQRKFQLNLRFGTFFKLFQVWKIYIDFIYFFSDLCIYYGNNKKIDIGNIIEVRTGFSTDTLNDIEKLVKKNQKIRVGVIDEENCFSIIFDPRYSSMFLTFYVKIIIAL